MINRISYHIIAPITNQVRAGSFCLAPSPLAAFYVSFVRIRTLLVYKESSGHSMHNVELRIFKSLSARGATPTTTVGNKNNVCMWTYRSCVCGRYTRWLSIKEPRHPLLVDSNTLRLHKQLHISINTHTSLQTYQE